VCDKREIVSLNTKDDIITLLEPDKDGFIFEIDDEMYLNNYLAIVFWGIFFFFIHYSDLASESIFRGLVIPAGAYALSYGAWHLYDYYKNGKKIKFYKDRIINENYKTNLYLKDIKYNFKRNYIFSNLSYSNKIKRINGSILIVVFIYIGWFVILLPVSTIIFVFDIIRVKRITIPNRFTIIEKNEKKDIINIQTYDLDIADKMLKSYFDKYINIPVSKMNKLYFTKKENTNE